MRAKIFIAALVAGVFVTTAVQAQSGTCTLFGSEAADESRQFFRIDPQTGEGTLIGDPGQGVTGLAFQPSTGVLYGATAVIDINSPTVSSIDPGHLITIDPVTGDGTDVGSFGLIGGSDGNITLADLAFDPATGVLYGWRAGNAGDLYTVNLETGAATKVGESGLTDLSGGGLEFGPGGRLFAALEGTQGRLLIISKATGMVIDEIQLTGYEGDAAIAALTWDGFGFLYGVTRKDGELIRINPETGEIETIGPAAGEDAAIDGLAFSACGAPAPAASWKALVITFLALSATGTWLIAGRRRQRFASF